LHDLLTRLVPHGPAAPAGLLVVVGGMFLLLFLVQTLCDMTPARGLPRRMYPWIYGGLFLDEAFTRVVFSLWPPPAAGSRAAPLPRRPAAPKLATSATDRGRA
jgi:NAD(P)H-quinone oxidoreductase subunit 5